MYFMRANLKSAGRIYSSRHKRKLGSDMNDLISHFINYIKPQSIYYSYHVYVLVPADICWWIVQIFHEIKDEVLMMGGHVRHSCVVNPLGAFDGFAAR